ncbi:Fic family protein [Gilvimarinus polysaccharolyticus]|uniref:Fic family protein n=1 Tax=Gilvimarinus polysaccharolyticus TaxID=863921 RepID=UPI0012FC7FB9|nr:Fic family protein [Gilvimarinus polysaccharolyticus]
MSTHAEQNWLKTMHKGLVAFQQKRIKTAYNYFKNATQVKPLRIEGWINLAESANQMQWHAQAIEYSKHALTINARLPQAYQIWGDALLESGRHQESVGYFQKALQLDVNAGSLYRMARSLILLTKNQEAETLLKKSIAIDPKLTAAHLLLTKTKLSLKKPEEALNILTKISSDSANPEELEEISSLKILASEYLRYQTGISEFLQKPNSNTLAATTSSSSPELQGIDLKALDRLKSYAQVLESSEHTLTPIIPLTSRWAEYEAFFMIPLVDSAADYVRLRDEVLNNTTDDHRYTETSNMISSIDHARSQTFSLDSALQAETGIRELHALATKNLTRFHPGQFKFFQNQTAASKSFVRPLPIQVVNTLQVFFAQIYPQVKTGLPRAILILMAIGDIHPFSDGNGRVALILLNRELEAAGLQPILLNRDLGILGQLGTAMNEFRTAPDKTPKTLIDTLRKGQKLAIEFCAEINLIEG